jgi:hypothetical protein
MFNRTIRNTSKPLSQRASGASRNAVFKNAEPTDETITMASFCLRQVNAKMMPTALRQCLAKAQKTQTNTRTRLELLIKAAEMARMMDKNHVAERLTDEIISEAPSGALDLIAAAKRLRVSLYLDAGDVAAAAAMIASTDGLEITSSEMLRENTPSLVTRHDRDVSPETWLREAEVMIYLNELEQAAACLEKCARAISQLELGSRQAQSLSVGEQTRLTSRIHDLRCELHLWDAVLRIRAGEVQGTELLSVLKLRLEKDFNVDRRIFGRTKVLSGDWNARIEIRQPAGLGFDEANRLVPLGGLPLLPLEDEQSALPHPLADLFGSDDLLGLESNEDETDSADTLMSLVSETSALIPASVRQETPLMPVQSVFGGINTPAVVDLNRLTQVLAQLTETLSKMPAALPPPGIATNVQLDDGRTAAFGGDFEHFNLITLLYNAELPNADGVRFTGYVEVKWQPNLVETSIMSKTLNPLARSGVGYIFIVEGEIVDATLASFEVPDAAAAGSPTAKADATNSLTVLIQIGLNLGLDRPAKGKGYAYDSAGVVQRPQRLDCLTQAHLGTLITEREKELGLFAAEDSDVELNW